MVLIIDFVISQLELKVGLFIEHDELDKEVSAWLNVK